MTPETSTVFANPSLGVSADENTPLNFGLTPLGRSMHNVTNHGTIQLRATAEDGYSSDSDCPDLDDDEKIKSPPGVIDKLMPQGGVAECTASLLSSMITPAILSLPLAFAAGGTGFCILCISCCIIMTVFSTRFLCVASMESGHRSYEGIARHYLGHNVRQLTRGILFFYNLGSSVVYLRFIADSIVPMLQIEALPNFLREQGGVYVMLFVWVLVTPLTFDARISSMRNKSFLSNFCTLSIVCIVVYRYFNPLPYMEPSMSRRAGKSALQYWLMPQFFVAPMIVFSFELQSNLVPVYSELSEPNIKSMLTALGITLSTATVFYTVIGYFGAATFGNTVSGNILNNYDPMQDGLIAYSLGACCVSAAVCFVFVLFPCRQAMLGVAEQTQAALMRFGGGISLLACLCAVFVPNVGAAISLLGSLCSSTLSMTLPSLFLLKVKQQGSPLITPADTVAAAILLPCGLIFGILGTLMSVAVMFVG